MTALPRALAGWANVLEAFQEDLALSIGPWLPRLSAAIGPMHVQKESLDGEVDGFDGIARRGTFERVLLTEWLYALEQPDEFLRRATTGEQAFLRLSRVEPHGSHKSVVLFDAGPRQLGAPRVAHLALLLVLDRRARRAGAEFAWGVLQIPDELHEEVTQSTVTKLLAARTGNLASPAAIHSWSETLEIVEPDDAWLVGGPGIGDTAASLRASSVTIEEPMLPNVHRLDLTVTRRRSSSRDYRLELPPAPECVRMLRDPFQARAPSPSSHDATVDRNTNLLICRSGRRLIASLANGGVMAMHIPNAGGQAEGRPRYFNPRKGERAIAADISRRRPLVLVADADGLLLYGGAKGEVRERIPDEPGFVVPRPGAPLGALYSQVIPLDNTSRYALLGVLDGHRFLWGIERGGDAGLRLLPLTRRPVSAVCHRTGNYVLPPYNGKTAEVTNGRRPVPELEFSRPGPADYAAFFCEGDHSWIGALAVRDHSSGWTVASGMRHQAFLADPTDGSQVLGVSQARTSDGYQLVCLQNDRRSITLGGPETPELDELVRSPDDIITATYASHAALCAWLDRSGRVRVISVPSGTSVLDTSVELSS